MSKDFNNLNYPSYELSNADAEKHYEDGDESIKSNVKNYQHPIFSSKGLLDTINNSRSFANTSEEPLSGDIPEKVFSDIVAAARKTKVPPEILFFMCDWEKDLTSRSDASDADGFAQKVLSNVNDLRDQFGRDPLYSEIFAAHILGSGKAVKSAYDAGNTSPEEKSAASVNTKSEIVLNKMRNGSKFPRTNREVYDFFSRRMPLGKSSFKKVLGKNDN